MSGGLRWWAVQLALRWLDIPYRWGGPERRPSDGRWFLGFDCSGLACEWAKSVGLMEHHEDLSAAGLLGRFAEWIVSEPVHGGFVFWMNGNAAVHVAITFTVGGGRCLCVGAIGGDRETTSLDVALRRDARVMVRPLDYRTGRRVYCDPLASLTSPKGGSP